MVEQTGNTMKSKLDLALEKLKENTCFSYGKLKLYAGCCKYGSLRNFFVSLTLAKASIPIAISRLKNRNYNER